MGEWRYFSTILDLGLPLYPRERASSTHSIGWMGHRTGLNAMEKRKVFTLSWIEPNPLFLRLVPIPTLNTSVFYKWEEWRFRRILKKFHDLVILASFGTRDEVEVNLRPRVIRSVCFGVRRPSGTCDQFFFLLQIFYRQLRVYYFVAPSLTIGWVCNLL
jgi:hypothetical protein